MQRQWHNTMYVVWNIQRPEPTPEAFFSYHCSINQQPADTLIRNAKKHISNKVNIYARSVVRRSILPNEMQKVFIKQFHSLTRTPVSGLKV